MQWTDDLGLTRREQETARRKLMALGVWEETAVGIPPRLATRVRLDALVKLLANGAPLPIKPWLDRVAADRDDLTISHAQNVGTSLRNSRDPVPTKPPIQFRGARSHCSHQTAEFLEQGSTSVSVQPLLPMSEVGEELALRRGGELIFPDRLQPEERHAARLLLKHYGSQGQALLDELAARMQSNAIRSTPIAYLRGLVAREKAGRFIPEAGLSIAAQRRRHAQETLHRQQRAEADQRLVTERASSEYRAKIAMRREEMRAWLDAAKTRKQGGCQS